MDYKTPRSQPEQAGASRLKKLMISAGWGWYKTHGNVYQIGWPDVYAIHRRFGVRWIETKSGDGSLRMAQITLFNEWSKAGVGIWILRDQRDYAWLFEKPNWHLWLDPLSRPRPRHD